MKDINEYLDAKTVIIAVLSILVIIIAVLSFQQWSNISKINALMNEQTVLNTQYQKSIQAIKEAQQEKPTNIEEEEIILAKIPATPDEAGLIENINALCASTSSDLKDIKFNARIERESYVELPLSVTLSTNYYSLVTLLEGLNSGERFLQPTGIEISALEETGLLSVIIDVSAFCRVQ